MQIHYRGLAPTVQTIVTKGKCCRETDKYVLGYVGESPASAVKFVSFGGMVDSRGFLPLLEITLLILKFSKGANRGRNNIYIPH